jgi:DNA-binding transcriptional LysR family regulator
VKVDKNRRNDVRASPQVRLLARWDWRGRSASAVAKQIRRLEQQLGISLFIRTNRKLILTDAARTLIPHAERAIMAVEQLAAAVDSVRNLTGGTVAFGAFSSAHHLLNTDLVVNFHALYPWCESASCSSTPGRLADAVREGDLLLLVDPVDTAVGASEVAERIPHFFDASDFAEELASCGGELG